MSSNLRLCLLVVLALLVLPLAGSLRAGTPLPSTEILFQAFPWDAAVDGQKHVWYRHLKEKAPALGRAGITHVWFPPASRSVAPQGYMPGDWYDLGHGQELGHNRTLYGTEEELKDTLRAYKRLGMVPIMDAVLNHRSASHQEDGVWNVFHHASGKAMWEKWALAKGDYAGTGQPDTGGDFGAAADIDHTNQQVQDDIVEFLQWMRDEIGFEGVRFDFTKGYAPGYARYYAESMQASFAVGELWTSMYYSGDTLLPDQDGHRQQLVDWVDGTEGKVSTFDFTTKGLLQEACRSGDYGWLRDDQGKAAGMIGWWPSRAVTFVDNHDTGSSQAHWPFPGDKVLQGYAYILTHPGVPSIFWDHFFAWGDPHRKTLTVLAALRHEAGIHRDSQLRIVEARRGLYAATVDDRVAVKLGGEGWHPGEGWTERVSGDGFVVWSR